MILIIISIVIIIFLLIRWSISPDLKLYKHCNWFIRIWIFLTQIRCYNCGRIAVRNVGVGKKDGPYRTKYCLNRVCSWNADSSYRGSTHGDTPIDGSLGWKYNKYDNK
jgi:hypothetical protein